MFKLGDLSTEREVIGGLDFYVIMKLLVQFCTFLYSLFSIVVMRLKVNLRSFFLVYLIVGILSSVLSNDIFKSLYFSFSVALAYLFICVYVRISGTDEWLEKVYVVLYKLIVLSTLISIVLFPQSALRIAYDYRLQSVLLYVGSNGLSWFLLCYFVYQDLAKSRMYKRLILLILLLLTQSRTAIVLLLCYILVRVLTRKKYLLIPLLVVSFLLLGHYGESLLIIFSRGETQFQHLSGRTLMWQYALESWQEVPWIGKGHWIGVSEALGTTVFEGISQLHSSYVEVLLASGVLGLLGWLLYTGGNFISAISVLWNKLGRRNTPLIVRWSSVIMIMYPVKMFSSSEAVYFDHSLLLLLLIGFTLKKYIANNEDSAFGG